MTAQAVAGAHYRTRQALIRQALEAAQGWWGQVSVTDLDGSWQAIAQQMLTTVGAAQTIAAQQTDQYLTALLDAQNVDPTPAGRLDPLAFSGVASDGRALDTLLYEPVITAKVAIGSGMAPSDAMLAGLAALTRIVGTQVADAGRTADGVGIAARPSVDGFVRMLNPPSCPRCTVLAGKFFRWNEGFKRHPHCDCAHVAVKNQAWALSEGFLRDPHRAVADGHVTGLSRADRRAILEDGADLGQVINAHRGMETANVYGRQLRITLEGVTKRGQAYKQLAAQGGRYGKVARLMPESIYRLAGDDRDAALRLLRRYGHLL